MSIRNSILRFRRFGFVERFVIAIFGLAAFNFLEIFLRLAMEMSRSNEADGYTLTACYFGPPPGYLPRFGIALSLLMASIGIFGQTLTRRTMTVIGLLGSLAIYVYWWMESYRIFKVLENHGVAILRFSEIKQVAYLFHGTWSDVSVAASLVVCLVLIVEKMLEPHGLTLPT